MKGSNVNHSLSKVDFNLVHGITQMPRLTPKSRSLEAVTSTYQPKVHHTWKAINEGIGKGGSFQSLLHIEN